MCGSWLGTSAATFAIANLAPLLAEPRFWRPVGRSQAQRWSQQGTGIAVESSTFASPAKGVLKHCSCSPSILAATCTIRLLELRQLLPKLPLRTHMLSLMHSDSPSFLTLQVPTLPTLSASQKPCGPPSLDCTACVSVHYCKRGRSCC